jgi:hypothetical protein
MARSYFRPFSKIVHLGAGMQQATISLVDSSGGTLPCNYVSVETSSGKTQGWVELHASAMRQWDGVGGTSYTIPRYASGTGAEFPPLASVASGTLGSPELGGLGGSGLLMTACIRNGGTAQLPLGAGDHVTTVGIRIDTQIPAGGGEDVILFTTYGNVKTGNSMKDDSRPPGV